MGIAARRLKSDTLDLVSRLLLIRGIAATGDLYRRFLAAVLCLLGPPRAYRLTAALARRFYAVADAVRQASESGCRAALAGRHSESEIRAIAQQAFVHRAWNLTDLLLAPRYLRRSRLGAIGGIIAGPQRGQLLEAQSRRQPVILLTAYYGPYDLLPAFLGLNGIAATAIYRPHPNAAFDLLRQSVRRIGNSRMVPQVGAGPVLADALERGGIVALVADHAAERHGVPVTFLGQQFEAPRTVALLARQYGAFVGVTVIRRAAEPFRFEIVASELIAPDEWQLDSDPIAWITRRYCAALERVILEQPEQYLWLHRRGYPAAGGLAGTLDPDYASGATESAALMRATPHLKTGAPN